MNKILQTRRQLLQTIAFTGIAGVALGKFPE